MGVVVRTMFDRKAPGGWEEAKAPRNRRAIGGPRGTTRRWALGIAVALFTAGILPAAAGPEAGSEEKTPQPRCKSGSLECLFCASYTRHGEALKHATREVGALPNGVVILYRADDPETIVLLQRYGFEKQKIRRELSANPADVRLCEECGALWDKLKRATFEVANSVHGVFTLITSTDPEAVRVLHKLASQETQSKGVRGS